ncbi:MAG TPA: hypothetical protein VFF14_12330 [Candidatus Deferrimicrobium sp.]|nr:hypothetical protein [Candidatus Deferrimicrobium sp.]
MDEDSEKMTAGAAPQPVQLQEAIRFSLQTLLGITDKIEELKPYKASETKPEKIIPRNLLDPQYSRPWWPRLAGLGILYLGYKALRSSADKNQETK